MNISVTKDGYVGLGNNQWASLEQIQDAVLKATNPGLQVNCPEGKPPKRDGLQVVNMKRNGVASAEQEHLPLPSTMSEEATDELAWILRNVANNDDQEHLPLPSSSVMPQPKSQAKQTANKSQEYVELPSTYRRTK